MPEEPVALPEENATERDGKARSFWNVSNPEFQLLLGASLAFIALIPVTLFWLKLALSVGGYVLGCYALWRWNQPKWLRLMIALIVGVIAYGGLLFQEIYRSTPLLNISIIAHNLPRSDYDRLGGLAWHSSYIDTRVFIENSGDGPAENLVLVLNMDAPVIMVSQISVNRDTRGFIVGPGEVPSQGSLIIEGPNRQYAIWTPDQKTISYDVRLECPVIAPKEHVEFVLALASGFPPMNSDHRRTPIWAKASGKYSKVGLGDAKVEVIIPEHRVDVKMQK
jgi:hypothetical protein